MKVVSTFHPPSSVTDSLKCHLTSDGTLDHLVVLKSNRLDVYSAQPEGLKHECSTEIWGRAAAIKSIPSNTDNDNLVLLTDHPDPKIIFLAYSVSTHGEASLTRTDIVNLLERNARPSEFLHTMLIDPAGDVVIVNCYVGKLRVIVMKDAKPSHDFDVIIPELNILSLAFASSLSDLCTIAILHLDPKQKIQLLARDLNIEELELSQKPSLLLPPTAISPSSYVLTETVPTIIPIPPLSYPSSGRDDDVTPNDFSGGILLVGGKKLMLFEFASDEWQEKYRGKKKRIESRKQSADQTVSATAKEKEKEREAKKRKSRAVVEWPWHEVTAWCYATDDKTRLFIADSYGRLALLSLDLLPTQGLILLPVGEISAPTALTYITSQILFVGSHFGDSQLVKIHSSPIGNVNNPTIPIRADILTVEPNALVPSSKGKGKATAENKGATGRVVATKGTFIEVVDTWKNLAPIVDAVLADTDGSGQPHIVTASGGRNTGSLRVIRNGADFLEQAIVEGLPSYTHIWPLRAKHEDACDSHILTTDGQETFLFRLDGSTTISHPDPSTTGFITAAPTLAAANIVKKVKKPGSKTTYEDSALVVQVTPTSVILVEYDAALAAHTVVSQWRPSELGEGWADREIVMAALNASQFVLGLSRGRLAILTLDNANKFTLFSHKDLNGEISALTCNPIDPTKAFSTYVAVSFWTSNRIEILSIVSGDAYLTPACPSITAPVLPRSLLLHNFGYERSPNHPEYRPHILVGLGDGTLVSYAFKKDHLEDKRVFSLGEAPVSLTYCEVDGKHTVFASGSRAAILYWERGSLVHSPVLLKDVTAGSRLNAVHWPSCLVLATANGLVIGKVQDLDRMHIHTIPLGLDSPRHIVHDPLLKAFGVASERTEPNRVGEPETLTSVFKLYDDTTLEGLGEFIAERTEEITAIHAFSIQKGDTTVPCYCVGTMLYKAEESEPSEGRLHFFTVQEGSSHAGQRLDKIATAFIKGCPYALAQVNGLIAAAISSSVVLFEVDFGNSDVVKKVSEWNHSYLVTSLVSRESRLFVGDAISSISVLDLVGEGSEAVLKTLARDYGSMWPVSIESWDQNSVIGANQDCNLFTFTVQPSEGRTVLERDGSFHLDDIVNKFLPGSLSSSDVNEDVPLYPKMLFFTASGRIGVILDAGTDLSLHLTALERNLGRLDSKQAADTSHTKWRAPVDGRAKSDADSAAFGFLDGDFLERFLDYNHPSPETKVVLAGSSEPERLKQSYSEIRQVLEGLQALH